MQGFPRFLGNGAEQARLWMDEKQAPTVSPLRYGNDAAPTIARVQHRYLSFVHERVAFYKLEQTCARVTLPGLIMGSVARATRHSRSS